MTYRIIQWATGGVGRAAIQGIESHPELRLVGCWVHSPDKVGQDVGEICGGEPMGVTATDDIDALLGLEADCVLYSPIVADRELVVRILASGKNVVTPLGWFYPGSRDVSDLEAACSKADVTLHGTGIHPGGITERFPLMISAMSRNVTHVRAEEFSDIRTYGAPFVVGEIMGFGKTAERATQSPMLAVMSGGFLESMDMVGRCAPRRMLRNAGPAASRDRGRDKRDWGRFPPRTAARFRRRSSRNETQGELPRREVEADCGDDPRDRDVAPERPKRREGIQARASTAPAVRSLPSPRPKRRGRRLRSSGPGCRTLSGVRRCVPRAPARRRPPPSSR